MRSTPNGPRAWAPLLCSLLLAACASGQPTPEGAARVACAPDDGGIELPDGFCATVFADVEGAPRHLAVAPNGDVFVALRGARQGGGGGVLALRDSDADGRADVREAWPVAGGTGIALRDEFLYFAPDDAVLRFRLPTGALRPVGAPDTIVAGLPVERSHRAKSIALAGSDLFVNIGSPSNACQVEDREAGSPGQDPCPELRTRAGIWRFDANRTGQSQADGERFATGIRNAVALTTHPETGVVYAAQHGRDQLFQNWPALYDSVAGAENPAEELFRVERGDDFGWPYCYFDVARDERLLAPEYGGDRRRVGRCAHTEPPILTFPGHWAPNGIAFYDAAAFPDHYRGGAFIAFHGSWNRAPLPQAGYRVVFVPMRDGVPTGGYETFASGFAGQDPLASPGDARHRPTGLAVGPDGALYITDDAGGRIWRVVYQP